MKVVCAPDSFKESMSAIEAAEAMARGVLRVWPDAAVVRVPLADGGEGTCRTLTAALGGRLIDVPTTDALGRPCLGQLGHVADRGLAIVEVASACGLELIEPALRDPRLASARGVGVLVRAALDLGVTDLVIGLGGTATNDAGSGMLAELGVRFLDADGADLGAGGAALARLARVDASGLDPRLAGVRVRAACDVDNPLLGERGASAVYGPQKGASSGDAAELDAALRRWADLVEPAVGRRVRDLPGAGAAGGLGAALLAFAGAELVPGATLVMDAAGLDAHLADADWVFTGEGSLDAQSASGKLPVMVAARAASAGVPCVAFAGRVAGDVAQIWSPGSDAAWPRPRGARLGAQGAAGTAGAAGADGVGLVAAVPIAPPGLPLPEALRFGAANLERTVDAVCRAIRTV